MHLPVHQFTLAPPKQEPLNHAPERIPDQQPPQLQLPQPEPQNILLQPSFAPNFVYFTHHQSMLPNPVFLSPHRLLIYLLFEISAVLWLAEFCPCGSSSGRFLCPIGEFEDYLS